MPADQVSRTVPPHVEYRLSEVGRSLSEALVVLDRWAETHFGTLDAARERYDAQTNR
ncbi:MULTISPECIES: winged helix-turn-helix transcriptional regulator [Sinorhizobium]|uniref:Winged helix-turn-helix transcriptional regulator n=1 Tax=Sinorhizobium kummerowiae TaxID=158892 RepID=A0ABY8TCB1_9HYPH|nr:MULTISPECIES: winged helix-turn-helix transcriptional regulator [Sinorhizobium]MCK3784412.1 helix-turn-helix transcriptional regulator [Sinorhizobium meliloti]MCK3790339.1 helix-turn-helix transcriptional regulator [Sinorhizobium meliloti]MCK3795765.1 helix-turn-helix transcriptional regulator [Sinorhizobium meliloti]MCK3802749.1 helix-turn-helix transcriptional regulator [Sinorhizobium meliloti]MCK3808731.1 helix-turn-helix transcriptional regulator [Sinorhizobium meliloti]